MNISICIPTHNASEAILPTLNAIENCINNVNSQENIEILVVDSACNDNTKQVVKSFWKECNTFYKRRYIEENRPGVGIARLNAFQSTTAEVLIYCDDDVTPSPNAVQLIINTARKERTVGAGGGVILPKLINGAEWPKWLDKSLAESLALRDFFDGPVYSPPNDHARWYPVSAFVWFRRKCLSAWSEAIKKQSFVLGPNLKQMWRADDLEMDYYVVDTGYQIKLDPSIKAWHRIPPSRLMPDYFRSLQYWVGRSMQRLKNRLNPNWQF